MIHGLLPDELRAWLAEQGEKPFRAAQIWEWLYRKGARDWETMSNLPKGLRAKLADAFVIDPAVELERQGEDTCKLLLKLADGQLVEEVLIPAPGRRTVCVSSQVGCKFACAFCASGQSGFRRNLEAGEIVAQVLLAGEVYQDRVSHVVFMGIGEPFDNYENVIRAARILNHPDGPGISARRITISTCGVLPGIRRLAEEPEQFELSVSLHAADDALRSRIMPVNGKYPLDELLRTCREYTKRTGRIITFEYTLVRDLNDRAADAERLARLLGVFPCRVNLIPLSPVDGFEGEAPRPETAQLFVRVLGRAGINTTVRRSKGTGANAACGQLRANRSGI